MNKNKEEINMNKDYEKKVKQRKGKKKRKYTDEEIARKRWVYSAAVFITRDTINDELINTNGKWIDVTQSIYTILDDKGHIYDFQQIDAELFEKKIKPQYEEGMSEAKKHEITYDTAQEDIKNQRKRGIKGEKYRIYLRLVQEPFMYNIERIEIPEE